MTDYGEHRACCENAAADRQCIKWRPCVDGYSIGNYFIRSDGVAV